MGTMLVIIPTVDAEGVHGYNPFESMMLGVCRGRQPHGLEMIAAIFNRFNLKATFFLDVYEYTMYGEDNLRRVCDSLQALDQDIQLHTHPAWRDDPRDFNHVRKLKREKSFFPQSKDFLFKCSLDEQVQILEHGVDCLYRWCGVRPVAHRAGGYGLNDDTLDALRCVGIAVDSSMNYGHPNSKVRWSINKVVSRDGIVEVPITGFSRHQLICLGPICFEREDPFRKTDLDACTLEDLLWFVDDAKLHDLSVMNLFMHSYSLLQFDSRYRWFVPNPGNVAILTKFLETTQKYPDVRYLSMAEFAELYPDSSKDFIGADYLPTRKLRSSVVCLARKRFAYCVRYGYHSLLGSIDKKPEKSVD